MRTKRLFREGFNDSIDWETTPVGSSGQVSLDCSSRSLTGGSADRLLENKTTIIEQLYCREYSTDQHTVSIAIESVACLDSMTVGAQNNFAAGEGCDHC
jgi:hypothetical protein